MPSRTAAAATTATTSAECVGGSGDQDILLFYRKIGDKTGALASVHYSIGHWVEDDPSVGDGSFSSPGALGFYPWIDKNKAYYGVPAREALNGALPSAYCGRLVRKAWLTGVAQ